MAVNFNYHTIEIRLPKGTLKRETLLATIEFIYALLQFVRCSDYKNNTQHALLKWLDSQPKKDKKERYSNLTAYLTSKDIFTPKQTTLDEICA